MHKNLSGAIGIALLSSLILTACGGEDTATVSRVIDGDTIEVNYRGNDATVRLLNIDTPETKHPNKQVECMGPEATEFLTELLPEGSKVTLEFDEEKTDKYDRLLAGVFTEDSTFVNEEIARNGFGNAIKIAPNEKFYPQILAAQEEATRNQVGLFDPEVSCSLQAQMKQVNDQLEEATSPEETVAAYEAAQELLSEIENLSSSVDSDYVENLIDSATFVMLKERLEDRVAVKKGKYRAAKSELADREAEAKRQAEEKKKAEESKAKKEEEKKKADASQPAAADKGQNTPAEAGGNSAAQDQAAQAEADRIAAEEAARQQGQSQQNIPAPPPAPAAPPAPAPQPEPVRTPNPAPEPTQAPAPDSGQGQNPYPGYTGPRCYAPGGKTWTPC